MVYSLLNVQQFLNYPFFSGKELLIACHCFIWCDDLIAVLIEFALTFGEMFSKKTAPRSTQIGVNQHHRPTF